MRKGFRNSLMALLAGAGLAVTHPVSVSAADPVVSVSFEDADQKTTSDGEKVAKPKTQSCAPAVMEQPVSQGLSFQGGNVAPGNYGADGDGLCGPAGRFWFGAEYLLWWQKGDTTPPLVTAGPAGTVPGSPLGAVLGQPGTSVIIGGDLNDSSRSGARFDAGYWLNDCRTIGIDGDYFFLGRRTGGSILTSNGLEAVGRPIQVPTSTGVVQSAELNAFPNVLAATKVVTAPTFLQGAGINGLYNLCGCSNYRVDLIGGFRWLDLEESVNIHEDVTVLPGIESIIGVIPGNHFPFIAGNNIKVNDSFATRNDFYGSTLGLQGEYRWGRVFVSGAAQVALGVTDEVVDINGSTFVTTPGGTPTELKALPPGGSGGLLALTGTNIGHYSKERFTVAPEGDIKVGYQLTDHLRASVGYTFLYWSHVARPGQQINTTVNPTFVPTNLPAGTVPSGAPQPTFTFHDSDYWAQGLDFGLEFDW